LAAIIAKTGLSEVGEKAVHRADDRAPAQRIPREHHSSPADFARFRPVRDDIRVDAAIGHMPP
jgi:hypothetical protein